MKREFNFTSILLVQIISVIVVSIFNYLFAQFNTDNVFINYITTFISRLIGAIFNYIIASGLINRRMGSVGDYFNQINTLNSTVILTNIAMSVIGTLVTSLLYGVGGLTAFLTIANSMSTGRGISGTLLTIFITGIVLFFFFLMTSYTNFVLADRRERNLSVGESISRIFKVGRDLLGRTFTTYLKYMLLPVIIYMILLFMLAGMFATQNSTALPAMLLIILSLGFLIYMLIANILIQARLSDNYIDYTGDTIIV